MVDIPFWGDRVLTQQQIYRLLNEENLAPRVKLECFLLVSSGARPAGMISLPGDLPDGVQLRQAIDQIYTAKYLNGVNLMRSGLLALGDRMRYAFQRLVRRSIVFKSMLMEETYQDLVHHAPTFQSHLHWAGTLGLAAFELQNMPARASLFIYKESNGEQACQAIAERQRQLRISAQRHGSLPVSGGVNLLPEERDPEYLRMVGRWLGYPDCCVEAYVRDRLEDRIPQERAAEQIAELRGRGLAPDERAYFIRDFIPCRPDCEAAASQGEHCHQAMSELDLRFAQAYWAGLGGNLAKVEGYIEMKRLREERHAWLYTRQVREGSA